MNYYSLVIARMCFAGIVPGRALVFENSAWLQRPLLTCGQQLQNFRFSQIYVLISHIIKTEVYYKTHIDWLNVVTSVRLLGN